ncbi:unnamed protein product [Amoebophrya sp. A25]|nr:unnamed protein product [Amoebophrya sp. A25]|eukprot:GSA25T00007536001.1
MTSPFEENSLEDEMAAIRARREKAQQAQRDALLGILHQKRTLEGGDAGGPPPKLVKTADGSSAVIAGNGATEGGASSSTPVALLETLDETTGAIELASKKADELDAWLKTFTTQLQKMEAATNFKHGLKIFEKIWLYRKRQLPYAELCELYAVLFTKPLTLDLIQHIDKGKHREGEKPTSKMQIRNREAAVASGMVNDIAADPGPEFVELKFLVRPVEIGLTQNIRSKTPSQLVKALYTVVKVHLMDVPYQNRAMFEPSSAEKNCILKLKDMVMRNDGEEIKSMNTRTIVMLLYCFALTCNQHFVAQSAALSKLALPRTVLRILYGDTLRGVHLLDSAQMCELAFAVYKFNELYTQVLDTSSNQNKLSAAAGLGIAHREPQEESVFHAISKRVLLIYGSMNLKHIADLVSIFASFGLKDEELFDALAGTILKNKGKMSEHDFQQVLRAYIKFNLPLREETAGFRNVAVLGKGDFTRPSDKPKRERFTYQRPEALEDR